MAEDRMILGIIQARMGSSRLPGKVMCEVQGKPLLQHMLERVKRSRFVNEFIVATTLNPEDDVIEELCAKLKTGCYRGSDTDVLDRYYQCAIHHHPVPDSIVRLTADCPLHDAEVIDFVVSLFLETKADYATNGEPPDFEDGFDVEVFTFAALERAWRNAESRSEREHVTEYLHNKANYNSDNDIIRLYRKFDYNYRYKLSVDTAKDFTVIRRIFDALYPVKPNFGIHDVVGLLVKNPAILTDNGNSTEI